MAIVTGWQQSNIGKMVTSIIASNILYTDPSENDFVMWFTKATSKNLFFINGLDISNGIASVPALLWIANKEKLHIYALKSDRKPMGRLPEYAQTAIYISRVDSVKQGLRLQKFLKNWMITRHSKTVQNTGWTLAIANPQGRCYCPLLETSGNRSPKNIRQWQISPL